MHTEGMEAAGAGKKSRKIKVKAATGEDTQSTLANPVLPGDLVVELSPEEKAKKKADERAKLKLEKEAIDKKKKTPLVTTAQVPHIFSDIEKLELGGRVCVKIKRLTELDNEKKAVMSDFTSRINAERASLQELNNKLSAGLEMRERDVWVFFKPSERTKFLFDRESGKFIRQEEMLHADFQITTLPLLDGTMKEGDALPPKVMKAALKLLAEKKKPAPAK